MTHITWIHTITLTSYLPYIYVGLFILYFMTKTIFGVGGCYADKACLWFTAFSAHVIWPGDEGGAVSPG